MIATSVNGILCEGGEVAGDRAARLGDRVPMTAPGQIEKVFGEDIHLLVDFWVGFVLVFFFRICEKFCGDDNQALVLAKL